MFQLLLKYFKLMSITLVITNTSHSDFIHSVHNSEGGYIADKNGNKLKFKGVNLGGWLMWESYIWHLGIAGETEIYNKLLELLPKNEVEQFRQDVYHGYIQESDIERISQLGMNVVRVPFNHIAYDVNALFPVLDNLIEWCRKYEIYIILDLHSAPYPQNQFFVGDWQSSDKQLWEDWPAYKNAAPIIWKEIASRYKEETIIAGYDLLNEPWTDWFGEEKLPEEMEAIIDSIRTVDTNHMVIVEGDQMAHDFSQFEADWSEPYDDNLSFEFHLYYDISTKNEQDAKLDEWERFSKTIGAPTFCGEYGGMDYASNGFTRRLFDERGDWLSGHVFWTWKVAEQKPGSSFNGVKSENQIWGIRRIDVGPNWSTVIHYIGGASLNKPSPSKTRAGIEEFKKAFLFENTTEDQEAIPFPVSTLNQFQILRNWDKGNISTRYCCEDEYNLIINYAPHRKAFFSINGKHVDVK